MILWLKRRTHLLSSLACFHSIRDIMTEKYDMGTPLGGERKARRLHSPLDEMDDMVPTTPVAAYAQVPPLPGPNVGAEPLTLAAIAGLLDQKPGPITNSIREMQFDIERVESNVTNVSNELTELRTSSVAIETRLDNSEARIAKLEELMKSGGSSQESSQLWEEVQAFKDHFSKAEHAHTRKQGQVDIEVTAVIGGLGALTGIDQARQWVSDQMWALYGPQPSEVYCKGDFYGMVFAKFANKDSRDSAVKLLRQARSSEGGNQVWAKPDRLLAERTLRSIAFGTKHAMTEWGWPETALWADICTDTCTGTVSLAGETVLTAAVEGDKVRVQYSEGWEKYFDDQHYPQVKELGDKFKKGSGKGKDKGRKGSTLEY